MTGTVPMESKVTFTTGVSTGLGRARVPSPIHPTNPSRLLPPSTFRRQGGSDGVIVAKGGVAGGYTLFIKQGKPRFEYNWYTQQRYKIISSISVAPGKNVVKVDFKYDGAA